MTYADFGKALAKAEDPPRDEPYSTSAISEWIAERSEPKARTYRAMADISGFRSAWLQDGELPALSGEGGHGAKQTNGAPVKPPPTRRPVVERKVQYLDPRVPTQGEGKAKKRRPKDRGDRTALAV